MRHPSEGTLRRLVDEPVGVADDERHHVATCRSCLAGLAEARRDAELVGAALDAAALDVDRQPDVEAAWARLTASTRTTPARPAPVTPLAPGRRRRRLRSPAVAAVGVAALLAGGGVAAAADWLPVFHTERITAVSVSEADLLTLPDLSAYGDLRLPSSQIREVASAAEAQRETGLSVPQVARLPRGVSGAPTIQVGDKVSALFTFSAAKAARAAGSLPPLPAGLDGVKVRLTAGPGVASVWSEGRGLPALVVGRAVAPTASSSGVPFATLRDYLLSLPGLPPELAAQLRALTADGSALPLPVPAGVVSTSTADVGGVPATVFTTKDGTAAGVVWVKDGVVTAVGGSLGRGEVLELARGLR